jgi:hypothetical protein
VRETGYFHQEHHAAVYGGGGWGDGGRGGEAGGGRGGGGDASNFSTVMPCVMLPALYVGDRENNCYFPVDHMRAQPPTAYRRRAEL